MTINERIFYLLKLQGKTQKDLASFTGISQPAITDWKKKGTNPSSDKLVKICEFFNVSLSWLLTGEEINSVNEPALTADEKLFLKYYQQLTERDKLRLLGNLEIKCNSKTSFFYEK